MCNCKDGFLFFLLVVYSALRYNSTRFTTLSHHNGSQYSWQIKDNGEMWVYAYDAIPHVNEISNTSILELDKTQEDRIVALPLNVTVHSINKLKTLEIGLFAQEDPWDQEAKLCRLSMKNGKFTIIPNQKLYIINNGHTHGYKINRHGLYSLCR